MSKNRKALACEKCGRRIVVGEEAEAARCWACTVNGPDQNQGPRVSLENPRPADVEEHAADWPLLGPCHHLQGASWVICPGCHRPAVLHDSDVADGRPECHACRAGTPRPLIRVGPRWGRPSPRHGEVPPQAPRLRALVARECCNWNRDGCLFLEGPHCCPPEGKRCAWFEDAVLPGIQNPPPFVEQSYVRWHTISRTETETRTCRQCGEPITGRHLYCPKCRTARRREQHRREKARQRLSHVLQSGQKSAQILHATPLNSQVGRAPPADPTTPPTTGLESVGHEAPEDATSRSEAGHGKEAGGEC